MNSVRYKIIDLEESKKEKYFTCLSDWSEEMQRAKHHKQEWFNKNQRKGLKVKLAVDEGNHTCGMIQYIPIESSFAIGENLYFILCIWVYGHRKGIGKYQKKGIGTALLKEAEEDAKSQNAKGMAAWGISIPIWMKASWFKKKGYKKVDKKDISILLWKKFINDAKPPKWIKQEKLPDLTKNKVNVTCFVNGWCQAGNMVLESAKEAVKEFNKMVEFKVINTSEKEDILKWGITDALYINHKNIFRGKPPTLKRIKKKINKQIKKLK